MVDLVERIVFGSGVTAIDDEAFSGCDDLKEITVSEENPGYCSEDGVLFNREKTELLRYPRKKPETSYTVPDSVTAIGEWAFEDCDNLTGITLPDGVTAIGAYAFRDCDNLTSITFPDSVTAIGDHAFSGCHNLTGITIPDSVTAIGYGVFEGTGYYLDDSNWDDGVLYIGNHLIEAREGGRCTVREGTRCIGEYAFGGSGLRSITLPDGVTVIGDFAFDGCSGLREIVFPDSVTTIGELAFRDCDRLREVTLGSGITAVGDGAFVSCRNLTEIAVSEENPGYCSVDGVLFNKEKTKLIQYPAGKIETSYTAPDGVTAIGNEAFEGCDYLREVILPDGVTAIGEEAFSGCHNLTGITLPDSVTIIGELAFSGCHNLTGITLPDGVTAIGDYAFEDCDNLTGITLGSGVTTIGKDAFSGCHSLTTVTIRALSDVHHICGSFPEGVTFIFLQRGDVNGEGTLDIIDMQMLFEHLSGAGSFAPTLAATVADVNADSETNILDYQALYRLIVNEDT